MWMQPAPAHHLGPMRMGLREPVEIYPLCRVASHALFGPWMTQRIATGCRTIGLYQNGPEAQAESSEAPGKHHFVSRMAAAATPENPDGSYPLPHHPSAAHPSRGSRPQANRIKSPRSRGWRSRRPGTSHPLSLGNLAEAGSKPKRNDDDNQTTRNLSRQIAIS